MISWIIIFTMLLIWTSMYHEYSSRIYTIYLILHVRKLIIVSGILFLIISLYIARFTTEDEWYRKYSSLYGYYDSDLFSLNGIACCLLWLNFYIIPVWKKCYINHHHPNYVSVWRKYDYLLNIMEGIAGYSLIGPTITAFNYYLIPFEYTFYKPYMDFDMISISVWVICFVLNKYMTFCLNRSAEIILNKESKL